jgi:hypothetical protein
VSVVPVAHAALKNVLREMVIAFVPFLKPLKLKGGFSGVQQEGRSVAARSHQVICALFPRAG